MQAITEQEAYERYDEMLDECYPVRIGNLEYRGSYVFKEIDEIAYSCGFDDWLDSEGLEIDDDIEDGS